jgi:hypothetical protein
MTYGITIEIELRKLGHGASISKEDSKWDDIKGLKIQEPIPFAPVNNKNATTGKFREVTGVSAIPDNLVIQTLIDDRIRLHDPLTLKIEKEGSFFVAKPIEVLQTSFGYGDDPFSAVDDFRETLSELYFTLIQEQQERELEPELARELQELNAIIDEVKYEP